MPHELGDLPLSYYILYTSIETHQSQAHCDSVGTNDAVEEATPPPASFWEQDVWTTEDKKRVQQQLNMSVDRCRIVDSSLIVDDCDAWNQFYVRHQNNFFKDRHYLADAFPDLFNGSILLPSNNPTFIEFGCGVGNTLLPLLDQQKDEDGGPIHWGSVIGIDLSPVAISILRKDPRFQSSSRCQVDAFTADLSAPPPPSLPSCSVACLLFCLSAIQPGEPQQHAAATVANTIVPGGVLLFRDFGRWDQSQLSLGQQRNKQVGDTMDFYQKHDGTKVHYFTTEAVCRLWQENNMLPVTECKYIQRSYCNRRTGERRRRVWVQGMFRKGPERNREPRDMTEH